MQRFKSYLDAVSHANGLPVGTRWLFHCGMLFGSPLKWWDDFGTRSTEHEGIDILFYETPSKTKGCLKAGSTIPAMDGGKVLNICDDLVSQTITIENVLFETDDFRIIRVYSHLIIEDGIEIGDRIKPNEIIGRIASTDHKKTDLPPHLHFSCIEIPGDHPPDELNWDLFCHTNKVNLINPVFL